MSDPLDARLPLFHSGATIALRDTYTADDSIWVPLQYGGVSARANALSSLPAHARVPVIYGGLVLTPAEIGALAPGGMDRLSLEDGSGSWEWETGEEIEWPREEGQP